MNDFILSIRSPHTSEREEKYKCLMPRVVKIKTHYTEEIQYFPFHESFYWVHWVDFTTFSTENGYPVRQIRLSVCSQGDLWTLHFLCCHPRAERRLRKTGVFLHHLRGTGRVMKVHLRKALHSLRRKGDSDLMICMIHDEGRSTSRAFCFL